MNAAENENDIPYVAVCMATYNHEKYIREAIEGVLMQKATFPVRLFIGEDCSPDNTRSICLSYAEKYPEQVTVLCTEKNDLWQNADNIWNASFNSGAKYIALCEGDDYWVDPYKLQKQIDFLDANPGFEMCFTDTDVKDELAVGQTGVSFPTLDKDVFTIEDIILSFVSLIPTASLVFRNNLPYPLPDFYYRSVSGDIVLHLLISDRGKAKYFKEKMVMYRNHGGGITKSKENIEKGEDALIRIFLRADKYFNYKYHKLIRQKLLSIYKYRLIYGARDKKGIEKLKHYFKKMPDYLKYSDKIDFKELAYYHAILFFPSLLKLFKKPAEI